jgi:hypothetical protein
MSIVCTNCRDLVRKQTSVGARSGTRSADESDVTSVTRQALDHALRPWVFLLHQTDERSKLCCDKRLTGVVFVRALVVGRKSACSPGVRDTDTMPSSKACIDATTLTRIMLILENPRRSGQPKSRTSKDSALVTHAVSVVHGALPCSPVAQTNQGQMLVEQRRHQTEHFISLHAMEPPHMALHHSSHSEDLPASALIQAQNDSQFLPPCEQLQLQGTLFEIIMTCCL